jgi:AspT/YidE/YbjL antiporter-like protein
MDWLQNLLFDENSIAHIVLLYSFVIAVGVLLGKIKFFGVSLGVTFVLFTGIVCGHFGLTGNTQILTFLQDFGLILFVFCIGLQVGPSFFSSFKKGGIAMNLVAMGIVALNIAVAVALYYGLNGRIELPMMVGILCGAVTNTPGLGAANEALSQLNYSGPQIAMGYACAYPLGVLGIIGSIIAIRYICRINLKKEEEDIAKEEAANPHLTPRMMHLEVHNEALAGKTLLQVRDFMGRDFVCSRILQNGHVSIPNRDTVFHLGDQLFVVCAEDDAEAIIAFIGPKIEVDWEKQDTPMVSRRILITQPKMNGKQLGGMAKAIETGVPKMRIEEAAARTQARIDSGAQTIVGTNKYRLEKEDPIDILEVDNTAVRLEQIENLKRLKEGRNQAEVDKALAAITECVKTGKGNLLELAVEAAHVRATLGEISDACETIVGRYKAVIRTISGVYSSESKKDIDFARACELTEEFAKKEGRRPRIMIAKMGQDGHDRGAKVVATGYADCGFDVDMGPLFQTVSQCISQFNICCGTCFLHVVARDGDGIELRHFL